MNLNEKLNYPYFVHLPWYWAVRIGKFGFYLNLSPLVQWIKGMK